MASAQVMLAPLGTRLAGPVLRVVALGIDDELLEADCHFQIPGKARVLLRGAF